MIQTFITPPPQVYDWADGEPVIRMARGERPRSKTSIACTLLLCFFLAAPLAAGDAQGHSQAVAINIPWTTVCNPWWWNVWMGTAKSGIAAAVGAVHVTWVFVFHVRRTTVGASDWQLNLYIQEQVSQRILGRGSEEGDGGGISYGNWDTITVHTEVAVNFRYYGDIAGVNGCIAYEGLAYMY